MSVRIVVVQQQALGSTVWAASASLLEDFGQAMVDITIGVDQFSFLRDMVATWPDLEKKHPIICFAKLFDHLNFTAGDSPGKTHADDSCFVLGSC